MLLRVVVALVVLVEGGLYYAFSSNLVIIFVVKMLWSSVKTTGQITPRLWHLILSKAK